MAVSTSFDNSYENTDFQDGAGSWSSMFFGRLSEPGHIVWDSVHSEREVPWAEKHP